jgi:hypothetical protein
MGHISSIRGFGSPEVPRFRRALGVIPGIFLLVTLFPNVAHAQKEVPLEYRLKATFLCNFTKFVTWPPETLAAEDAPLKITIVGEDPFGSALDDLVSKAPAHQRPLVIERRNWSQDLRHCQVLFISRSEKRRLNAILSGLKGASVLTASEIEHFSDLGGMIGFVFDQDRVRFEINLEVAVQARLQLSSPLLMLATTVRK